MGGGGGVWGSGGGGSRFGFEQGTHLEAGMAALIVKELCRTIHVLLLTFGFGIIRSLHLIFFDACWHGRGRVVAHPQRRTSGAIHSAEWCHS